MQISIRRSFEKWSARLGLDVVGGAEQVESMEEIDADRDVEYETGLSLYQFNACPFCARVRHAADDLGIRIELRDTLADAEHARAVVEATGRRTVPVLRIEGEDGEVEWLPESADIVRYLRDRFEN